MQAPEPHPPVRWTSAIPIALVAASGYALLELAFVAERNLLLPWSREHAALGALFFVLHAAVAIAAALAGTLLARTLFAASAPGFAWFSPLAALVAIHALTHYRERVNALPRDAAGTIATAGIVALFVLGAWAHARVLRDRPGWARGAALLFAGAILAIGVIRVATARPPAGEAPISAARPASDTLTASQTGARVLLFGFDGATWDVLDELIAAGRMPQLAALAARGRTFTVETIRPTFSPIIWTSVSTGKTRDQHGIHDVVQAVLPGGTTLHRSLDRTAFLTKTAGVFFRFLDARGLVKLVPYRSSQIRSTSIFEAASEAGLPATQIEWFVSWPARRLSGTCVSDRFHLQAPGLEPLPGAVAPDSANAGLRSLVVAPDSVSIDAVLALVDTEGMSPEEAASWAKEHHAFVEETRINLARDLTTRNVALALLDREPHWRIFSPYFRAVDVSHHLTWKYRGAPGDAAALRANPELRLRTVVDRYHELMDRILGEVLARVPADAAVLVLSDHGFEDRYGHSQAPDGFAVAAGGPFTPAADRGRLRIYDIAPTLAAILGLPIPEDIVAKPRADLLDPAFLAVHAPRSVPTWEREGRHDALGEEGGVPGAMDDEEIERLRAIGYIR
jgi:hypothetical protein